MCDMSKSPTLWTKQFNKMFSDVCKVQQKEGKLSRAEINLNFVDSFKVQNSWNYMNNAKVYKPLTEV